MKMRPCLAVAAWSLATGCGADATAPKLAEVQAAGATASVTAVDSAPRPFVLCRPETLSRVAGSVALLGEGASEARDAVAIRSRTDAPALVVAIDAEIDAARGDQIRGLLAQGALLFVDEWGGDPQRLLRFCPDGTFRDLVAADAPLAGPNVLAQLPLAHEGEHPDPRIAGVESNGVWRVLATVQNTLCHGCSCEALPGRLAFGANLAACAESVAAKSDVAPAREPVVIRTGELEGTRFRASAEFQATSGRAAVAQVEVVALDGRVVATVRQELAAGAMESVALEADLPAPLDLLDHRLVATLVDEAATRRDVRPLADLVGVVDFCLAGSDTLRAGGPSTVRVVCRNSLRGDPVVGAALSLELLALDGHQLARADGTSDGAGTASLVLAVPVDAPPTAKLRATARSALATDSIESGVAIASRRAAHLFCDLPIHRPGDEAQVRALLVSQPSGLPCAGQRVAFVLRRADDDAKLAAADAVTDAFGVASATIKLPADARPGECRIVLVEQHATVAEVALRVERFETPTFRVTVDPAGRVVAEGTELAAIVRAERFDGKPLAGAEVSVALVDATPDSAPLVQWEGRTDEWGAAEVGLPVPRLPRASRGAHGAGALMLAVSVRDAGGRVVRESATLATADPAGAAGAAGTTQLLQPDGPLVPGRPGRVLVATACAPGARIEVALGEEAAAPHVVDEFGIVEVAIADPQVGSVLRVAGASYPLAVVRRPLALTLERRVVAAGGTVVARVATTAAAPVAFVDLLRDGTIVATSTVPLAAGAGSVELRLPDRVVGPIAVRAYLPPDLRGGTPIADDARALLVVPPEELRVTVAPSRAEASPGDSLDVDITVTDTDGSPTPALLAIRVADEAVLSLVAAQPDCVRAVLLLDEAVRNAKQRVGPLSATGVASLAARRALSPAEARVADALFAVLDRAVAYRLGAVTLPARVAAYPPRVRARLEQWSAALAAAWTVALTGPFAPARSSEVDDLVKALRAAESAGAFGRDGIVDPWGAPLSLELTGEGVELRSTGPDAIPDSDDDCSTALDEETITDLQIAWLRVVDVHLDAAAERAAIASAFAGRRGGGIGFGGGGGRGGGRPGSRGMGSAAPEPVRPPSRMRRLFPAALLWNPALPTDAAGRACVGLVAPDSLTTWRIEVVASDSRGRASDGSAAFATTRSFSADLDPPPVLLVGDEIELPAIVRWSVPAGLQAELSIDVSSEGRLLGSPVMTVATTGGSEAASFVRVRAMKPGAMRLTLRAEATTETGRALSDAVERVITVLPAGRPVLRSVALALEQGGAAARARLDRATRAELRIAPTPIAELLEGVEGLLRMPHGCFEQASSCVYPDVLALAYLRRVERSTPDAEARFGEAIDDGVTRLLAYEIRGGGFDWFGRPAAKPLLTAYGLHEWVDIAAVRPATRAVAERTAAWLASIQEPDGSFPLTDAPHHWVAEAKGATAATAYVAWALARSGGERAAVAKAVEWLRPRLAAEPDAYALALAVAALTTIDAADPAAAEAAARLAKKARRSGDLLRFEAPAGTALHGRRGPAAVETTAIAALAALQLDRPELLPAQPLLKALARDRGADGTWGTTQATVLALRAALAAATASEASATSVTLRSRGRTRTVDLADGHRDLPTIVDLSEFADGKWPLDVEASITGGDASARFVTHHTVPFDAPEAAPSRLRLTVQPDRSSLARAERVSLAVRLEATSAEPVAMPIVELPLAAGFVADPDSVDALRRTAGVERVETDARAVVIYLRELRCGAPFVANVALRPRLRGTVTAPPASANPYYEPDARAHGSATTFTVK